MTYYVVIPAYNEAGRISQTIEKVKKFTNQIIVVDDGSKDSTYSEAKKCEVKVLRHAVNMGKGAALKTGCDYAIEQGALQLIVLDADGQHDPAEIPRFVEALQRVEIAFGKRRQSASMPVVFKFGNKVITKTLKLLYNIEVNDSQCGYRAFNKEAYQKVRWAVNDYFMETEMIVNAGKHHLRSEQLDIETIYADKYKGTTIFDGVKIVGKMFAWRLFK